MYREGNAAKKQIICVYFEKGEKESGGHKKGNIDFMLTVVLRK
jgi:hypothetical protein